MNTVRFQLDPDDPIPFMQLGPDAFFDFIKRAEGKFPELQSIEIGDYGSIDCVIEFEQWDRFHLWRMRDLKEFCEEFINAER
jgi:hypothetical protein